MCFKKYPEILHTTSGTIVSFTSSRQTKYSSGRWLRNEEERECLTLIFRSFLMRRVVRKHVIICGVQRWWDPTSCRYRSTMCSVQESKWRYAPKVFWVVSQGDTLYTGSYNKVSPQRGRGNRTHSMSNRPIDSLLFPTRRYLRSWTEVNRWM